MLSCSCRSLDNPSARSRTRQDAVHIDQATHRVMQDFVAQPSNQGLTFINYCGPPAPHHSCHFRNTREDLKPSQPKGQTRCKMAVTSLLLFAAAVLASPQYLKLDFTKNAIADPNLQKRAGGSVGVALTQSSDKIVWKTSRMQLHLVTDRCVGIFHRSHNWHASPKIHPTA